MRLYVIGGEGQVARSLREAAMLDKDIVFGYGAVPASIYYGHHQSRRNFRLPSRRRCEPAAYTAVDKAESEPDQAFALNRAVLVSSRRRRLGGARRLFISRRTTCSTGRSRGRTPRPIRPHARRYGQLWLAGELAVADVNRSTSYFEHRGSMLHSGATSCVLCFDWRQSAIGFGWWTTSQDVNLCSDIAKGIRHADMVRSG
jgi:hypothetical protein